MVNTEQEANVAGLSYAQMMENAGRFAVLPSMNTWKMGG
jgi:hypothetical protein